MLDIQDVVGTIKSLNPKTDEASEGELKSLRYEPKLVLRGPVTMLNQFIDASAENNTNPSDVFWWGGAEGSGKYVRWLDIEQLVITVNRELEHTLKLYTIKLEEEAEVTYQKSRIELVMTVKLKGKAHAEPGANLVTITVDIDCAPNADQQNKLSELFRREKIGISLYQRQADLVQEAQTPPPRVGGEQKFTGVAGTNGDAMYDEACKWVAGREGNVSAQHLRSNFKIGFNRAAGLLVAMVDAGLLQVTEVVDVYAHVPAKPDAPRVEPAPASNVTPIKKKGKKGEDKATSALE